MQTTRLSSKGQVVIPKAFRDAQRWLPGQELVMEASEAGLLLRPVGAFAPTEPVEVAGLFKGRVPRRTDAEIAASLNVAARRTWRGRD